MTVRPLRDQILIRPVPEPDKTDGGILIPDAARERQSRFADVLAVGPGREMTRRGRPLGRRIPVAVAVGDRVAVYRGAADEFEVGGEKVVLISEGDVLAVVERAAS